MASKPHVILLGSPGSGKGTQAKNLACSAGFTHLSTGDLVREQIDLKTELGLKIKQIVESGEFPSDEIIVELVSNFVRSNDNAIIFDGFPRTSNQAKIFLAQFSELVESGSVYIFYIDVPDELVVQRLTKRFMCSECGSIYSDDIPLKKDGVCDACGTTSFTRRVDDQEDSVRKRLSVYAEKTKPMIDYLKSKLPYFTINGDQDPTDVARDIQQVLAEEKLKIV